MQIEHTDLEIQREPFARPFAFKGAAFHEKWNLVVRLRDDAGHEAFGLGGLAVLWSDARVFARHSEVGGNALMVAILERGLALAREAGPVDSPTKLLNRILPEVETYARSVTGVRDLSRTFILNALVALDNAVWMLWCRAQSIHRFDEMIPPHVRPALANRQRQIALAPAVELRHAGAAHHHDVAGLGARLHLHLFFAADHGDGHLAAQGGGGEA